jgi:hypothetical protein
MEGGKGREGKGREGKGNSSYLSTRVGGHGFIVGEPVVLRNTNYNHTKKTRVFF